MVPAIEVFITKQLEINTNTNRSQNYVIYFMIIIRLINCKLTFDIKDFCTT